MQSSSSALRFTARSIGFRSRSSADARLCSWSARSSRTIPREDFLRLAESLEAAHEMLVCRYGRCRWKVIRSFIMKSGSRSCALAAASSSALGINRRKITHTSTSIWAMPVRSAAPIALRYSVSIRAWAHTKLIRQIVLTVTWTKLKSSNAASLVMLPAANQRQAPSCRSLGAVHDGHERSEFGRMQASRRPNQR
jgi:hypothetical protein